MSYSAVLFKDPALWQQHLGETGAGGAKLAPAVEIRGQFKRTRETRLASGGRESVSHAMFRAAPKWVAVGLNDVFVVDSERFRVATIDRERHPLTGRVDAFVFRLIPEGA